MAELTADQQVLQVKQRCTVCHPLVDVTVIIFAFLLLQFKDFLSTYNKVTEGCFMNCVNDFKSRTLTNDEVYPLCLCYLNNVFKFHSHIHHRV